MATNCKEEPTEHQTLIDISGFLSSPQDSHVISSSVPAVCLEEETLMGIDEAGRGPVLGPMVYGTCYCPITRKETLEEKKFADSKTLSAERREEMFSDICKSNKWIGWKVTILSPNIISNSMLKRTKYSLNELSHDTAIDLIRKVISDGIKLSEVYVDTVGDPRKYESKLSTIFPNLKITVAKKADSLFPIVSAASICAKVTRDACLNQWQFIEGGIEISTQFGSGYPSDPTTKQWMSNSIDPVFGYPSIVRFSWSTCQEKLDSKAFEFKWPDEDEEDQAMSVGYAKINQFFTSESQNKQLKRHRYFEETGLKAVYKF